MGTRRDDITGKEQAQIAIEMLGSYRPYGKVTQLAQKYVISRQAIYRIATIGKTILNQGTEAGPHGARIREKSVRVNREHIERSTVILTKAGVSQRDISTCLEELLETRLSASWVNAQFESKKQRRSIRNGSPTGQRPCQGMRFTRMDSRIYYWSETSVCIFTH